jgi:hypothetical protein
MDLVSNNIVRGRLSSLGEFFIGTTNTVLAGDLMNGVGNATFPWAVNGYTDFNGSGVYGRVNAGATLFAGVQGEYFGTNAQGAGVRGIYGTTTAGTSFNAVAAGVTGTATTAGSYKFGTYGSGGTSTRSGGVMGYDYGFGIGALGYFSAGSLDYSVYGFGGAYTVGVVGGKTSGPISNVLSEENTHIGLGIYGGFMGGWVKGLVYGTMLKGERYGLYVDGKTYMNEPITQLIETSGDKQPVYGVSAMKVEVSDRGKSNLKGGTTQILFTQEFKNSISSNTEELTITISPMGNSNGIFIESYDENGFVVRENNNGGSSVQFTWIAIGTRKDYETINHSAEIIANDFEQKMDGVMFNDNNTIDTPQPIWWDGSIIRFDAVPEKQPNTSPNPAQRFQ